MSVESEFSVFASVWIVKNFKNEEKSLYKKRKILYTIDKVNTVYNL